MAMVFLSELKEAEGLRIPLGNPTYNRMNKIMGNGEILNITRRSKFIMIKKHLQSIRLCLQKWEYAPNHNKEYILNALKEIEDIARSKDEPNHHRKLEWENGFINKTAALGIEIRYHGLTPDALQYFKDLYKTYKKLYHNERFRQFEVSGEIRKSI